MKRFIFFVTLLIALSKLAFPQHADVSSINETLRKHWINSAIDSLKHFTPGMNQTLISLKKIEQSNKIKLSIRVKKEGLLKISNKKWIYIKTSSSHDNQAIGDVCLAMDDNKNIYVNYAHVCGGIIHFETTAIDDLKKTRDFFRYFVSDVDSSKWEKLE